MGTFTLCHAIYNCLRMGSLEILHYHQTFVKVIVEVSDGFLNKFWPVTLSNREFVAGSVIQATGTVEFENGLRTGVLQEDSWCPYSCQATFESDMASWMLAPTQVQYSPRKDV